MKISLVVIIPVIMALILTEATRAQARMCAENQGRSAMDEAGILRSWEALYHSYNRYRQCDDGAIGEGYSESVARILVDRWDTLHRLDQIAKRDVGFRAFVMRHLDATLNMDDIEEIKKKALTHCPAKLHRLCIDLIKRADLALKESAQ